MDTTSHNFVWTIDTLGESGSYLNDVAIIDENNIWVVGYIKDGDSTYNAAHWDGSGWVLYRLPAVTYSGSISRGTLTSIHAINGENIWCSSDAGSYVHWNGHNWQSEWVPGRNGGINAIWGTSSSNMYFVGNNGSIVHYDGSSFTRMESGTEVDLLDIDGTPDGEHVFAFGWDYAVPAGNIVLEYNGVWKTIYYKEGVLPTEGNYGGIEGIGVFQDTLYISTVAGLWKYNYLDENSVLIPDNITNMGNGAFIDIHIVANNDIFFDGAGYKYIHFNGSTYYYSQEITDMYPQRANLGSNYNGDLVVIVGYFNWWQGALVARGYHE